MMERLQKIMAQAGIASRRKAEEMIKAGRVQVNDEVVKELGTKVDPDEDIIVVDGKKIREEKKVYLLFHKPKGVITSVKDPKGRKTVTDFMTDIKERVYPVGRLDYDTEGLLILTNDGEFANALMHPKHEMSKIYHAYIKGIPHGNVLDKLKKGVQLEDGMTGKAEVEYVDVLPDQSRSVISITIHEGKNRQVRRMFEAVGYPVEKLRRVKLGFLTLEGVSRGNYRELTKNEVDNLMNMTVKTHKIQKED